MPITSNRFINHTEVEKAIEEVIPQLGPDVVHVAYNLGEELEWRSRIFFRVVLTNAVSVEGRLGEVARRISTTVFDQLKPQENWGLFPYFSFRSEAEHLQRPDPQWA